MSKHYETPNYNELYRKAIVYAAKDIRELMCPEIMWEMRVRELINKHLKPLFTGLVEHKKFNNRPPHTRHVVAFCPDCLTYGSPMSEQDKMCGNCGNTNCRIYIEQPEAEAAGGEDE